MLSPSETPSGRPVDVLPSLGLQRIPTFLLSPSPSPARKPGPPPVSCEEHFDILGELFKTGNHLAAHKIISYLTLKELFW